MIPPGGTQSSRPFKSSNETIRPLARYVRISCACAGVAATEAGDVALRR